MSMKTALLANVKKIIASINPGVTDISKIGDGTLTGAISTLKNLVTTAQSTADTAKTTADGKAPTSHASTSTTYGKGTSSNYGHVKLSDSVSSTSSTSDGVATTPKAVKSAYDLATTANNNASNALNIANKAVKITHLYLNTNYAVAFAEQVLSLEDYPMYIVEFKQYNISDIYEHISVIVVDRTKAHTSARGNSAVCSRSVEKVNGGLKFYNAYLGDILNNDYMIPFKIWGVSWA